MAKIRVYELAKELGVDNKAVVTLVQQLGISKKASHSNSLEDDEADQVRRAIIRTALGTQNAPGVKETIERDSDGNAVTIRRKGNIIRRRKGADDEKEDLDSGGHTTGPLSVEGSAALADAEEIQPQDLSTHDEGSNGSSVHLSEPAIEAIAEEENTEAKELAPIDVASESAEVIETKEAVIAPETGKTSGPRILGRIELPKKKIIPPKEKIVKSGTAAPAEDGSFSKKPSDVRRAEREKRGRRKEFTRVDLVDYDGRLIKRTQRRKGGRGDRTDDSYDNAAPQEAKATKASKKIIQIDEVITVGELAKAMSLKSGEVIKKLIDLGQIATINQAVDLDTATLIAEEFGFQVQSVAFDETEILTANQNIDEAERLTRPPVVTVMGHVDHGKTSLLDVIRLSSVATKEHGGITQHIGAYQVVLPSGQAVTFIDTPGHAAFTSMRARGAKVTDIVILVVAADDGVMPQTIEAITHAKAANVPIVVAVNKMDKPGANPDRVKQQLADHGLQPEDWGGDTMFFQVSAIKKQGLDKLLEGVLLQAEVLEVKANPKRKAAGTIIESRQDKGRGIVATVLVQNGTLKTGEDFVCGAEYGRVRSMWDYTGAPIKEATPSTPVEVTGFSGIPEAGDDFYIVDSEADAREVASVRAGKRQKKDALASTGGPISFEAFAKKVSTKTLPELNIIVKGDVHGSVEAVKGSIEKLVYAKVKVAVIHAAVGGITESDVKLAQASRAVIVGFGVRAEPRAAKDAEAAGVEIRYYNIIYNLIEDIQKAMTGLLPPIQQESSLGRVEVRDTFVVPKIGTIAGCYVLEGLVKRGANVRLIRDSKLIHEGKMSSLRRFKDDAKEVQSGYECGIGIDRYNDLKVGDIIEAYEFKQIADTLS